MLLQSHDLPASSSQMLGLQACSILPHFSLLIHRLVIDIQSPGLETQGLTHGSLSKGLTMKPQDPGSIASTHVTSQVWEHMSILFRDADVEAGVAC